MSLRARLAITSAIAVGFAVIVAVIAAQSIVSRELMEEIDQSLRGRAAQIGEFEAFLAPGSGNPDGRGPRLGPDNPLGRGASGFDALYAQLLMPDGTVTPLSEGISIPVSAADIAIANRQDRALLETVEVEGDRLRVFTVPTANGALQLSRSLSEFDTSIRRVTGGLTIAGGVGMLLAGLFGLAVARSGLRPVDRLNEAVDHAAGTGDFDARIEVMRTDEVGRLATSFNALMAALESSKTQQQQLVRDAGHELRTPLTALRTNIELLSSRGDSMSSEQRKELVTAAEAELRELTTLSTELVDLAADAKLVDEPLTTVHLGQLVEEVIARYKRRTDHVFVVSSDASVAEVRVSAIDRAVSNLLVNAAKWSPAGSTVTVDVHQGTITVSDSGLGIRPNERERVFDRFYRSDAARTHTGSGLGLAIVKKVVEDHDGTVFVKDSYAGGASVGFTIPTTTKSPGNTDQGSSSNWSV